MTSPTDAGNRRRPRAADGAPLPAFTLIELLVAAAIASVVAVLLVGILIQLYQVTAESVNRLALVSDTNLAAQMLARDVNSAASVSIPSPRHMTLTQPDPTGGPDRIVTYAVSPPLLVRSEGGVEQTAARHVSGDTTFGPAGVVSGAQLVAIRLVVAHAKDSLTTVLQLNLRPQP